MGTTEDRELFSRGELRLRALLSQREVDAIEPALAEISRLSSGCVVQIGSSNRDDVNLKLIGTPESLGKAAGLIARATRGESFEGASTADSKVTALRLIVQNRAMGAIMGRGGQTHREIERESASTLASAREMIEGSSDRLLTIEGVPDAVHIAVFYCAKYMLEQAQKFGNLLSPSGPASRRSPPPRDYAGDPRSREPPSGPRSSSSRLAYDDRRPSYDDRYSRPRSSYPDDRRSDRYRDDRRDDYSRPGPSRSSDTRPPARYTPYDDPRHFDYKPRLGADSVIKRMTVSGVYVPAIIGQQGRNIREIRAKSRCDVQIPDTRGAQRGATEDRIVEIEGRAEDVEVAVTEIERIIKRFEADHPQPQTNGDRAPDSRRN